MNVQPWGQQYPQPQRPQDAQMAMRAGHTDRERAVDVLKAAYAEGRLSADEYGQRFEAVQRAQTYGQLAYLVSDLPVGPAPTPMLTPMVAAVPVPPPYFPPPRARTNPLAVTSLILGVLCLPSGGLLGVPAVLTGHLAKGQIRQTREEGDSMANAGLVLGWLSVGLWVLVLMGMIASA
ncbi:DUF1707 and DUF4190 domain-containing protein [Kitasatospora sp. NPDC096147]|uniref:DUF1707 and DUF4190 domain-containing protein n=1 Tax=Kitasatospora sp. NPDC096147 TaxID=3364093 RepID=UPI00380BA623